MPDTVPMDTWKGVPPIAKLPVGHLVNHIKKSGDRVVLFISRSESEDRMRADCLAFIHAWYTNIGDARKILRDLSCEGIGLVVVEPPTEHQIAILRAALNG